MSSNSEFSHTPPEIRDDRLITDVEPEATSSPVTASEAAGDAKIIPFPVERIRTVAPEEEITNLMMRAPRVARVLDYMFRLDSDRRETPLDPHRPFFGSRNVGQMVLRMIKDVATDAVALGRDAVDHLRTRRN